MTTTREHFARHGISLDWGRNKVVLKVGRDEHKIVCSPEAFRWLRRLVENSDWTDPILEAELAEAEHRRLRALRRKNRANPEDDTPDCFESVPFRVPGAFIDSGAFPFAAPEYGD